MKQKKLVKKLFKACLDNDTEAINKIRIEEYKKIFKRKDKNKPFSPSWTIVRV